nr:hypothetical protein CFP56_32278 [Quercus suber]
MSIDPFLLLHSPSGNLCSKRSSIPAKASVVSIIVLTLSALSSGHDLRDILKFRQRHPQFHSSFSPCLTHCQPMAFKIFLSSDKGILDLSHSPYPIQHSRLMSFNAWFKILQTTRPSGHVTSCFKEYRHGMQH